MRRASPPPLPRRRRSLPCSSAITPGFIAISPGGSASTSLTSLPPRCSAVAFAKRGRYDGSFENARPWLFGIATKLAQRHWRREERELRAYSRTGVDPAAPSHDERAAARADSATAGPALAAALATLSREERNVLLLHAWEDLGHAEIAAALGISPGTVKSRLHRARQRVRQSLAVAGELDPTRTEADE
jgi:RNA polymerase sigma factor (sigma-70 family)